MEFEEEIKKIIKENNNTELLFLLILTLPIIKEWLKNDDKWITEIHSENQPGNDNGKTD